MSMFCYQCQETAKNTGCTVKGVCGKSEETAKLQDLIIYTLQGIAELIVKGNVNIAEHRDICRETLNALFMTITNANFDDLALETKIVHLINMRDRLAEQTKLPVFADASTFKVSGRKEMLTKASLVGVLATSDEDIRSLKQTIIYGLKGIAAYAEHALNLGKEDPAICMFIFKALSITLSEKDSLDQLLKLVLETGEYGIKVMALLDRANTEKYGNPVISEVNIGTKNNPAILVSGHDLYDLEQLLEQTKDSGVDVYTHGEMLPAHYYPFFKKYPHLVGNYGNAWWKQLEEFETFKGPILFTTNCIVPPRSEEVRKRIFTTGAAGYPQCIHIMPDKNGKKDFLQIISLAKTLPPPVEIEKGKIVGGFAHNQVTLLADKVVTAVKSGAIKRFIVMAGCDGRNKSREYYTQFAQKLPADTVILTAGCAKYRYNKLNLGDINGIPRVLDAGQCNDSYSLVLIALKLMEAFGLTDVNQLPLSFNIAWYEQKAVIVLLALLHLGIKNIHLGPTLPGFLSENVKNKLIKLFKLASISNVEDDINLFLGA